MRFIRLLYIKLLIGFLFTSCTVVNELPDGVPSSTPTLNPPANQVPYISEFNGIKLAYFYKPPELEMQFQVLPEYFDLYILTKNDEDERDHLQGIEGTQLFLQYLLFGSIMDPGSCIHQPWQNQVAYQISDFCLISEQHPDWFLLSENGFRIAEESELWWMLDPMSDGWREFWLERARISQEELGWKGVFLDNVEGSLKKRERVGWGIPVAYPDEESYQSAIEDNLRHKYNNYFKPEGRPLFANIIDYLDIDVWARYLKYLDGAMMEDFAVDFVNNYHEPERWEMQMEIAEMVQEMGKTIILVSQGSQNNLKRQEFALASYLLVNNGKALFRYTNSENGYDKVWLYKNYLIDPGQPLGERYKERGIWRRDFTNGCIIVDPVDHSYLFSFND